MKDKNGLTLAKEYYEELVQPMILRDFAEYEDKIAVGLVGRGSDCFGYDDESSRDHDWGPGVCLWVSDDTWEKIGSKLQEAYEQLPVEFKGYKRAKQVNGKARRGAMRVSDFYKSLLDTKEYDGICWQEVKDSSLAAAVNGEVFYDAEGMFSMFRHRLEMGYPENILYLKIAETAAEFAQMAEYNFPRMLQRDDELTAEMMLWSGIQRAMRLQILLDGKYPPHDKWLCRCMEETERGKEVSALLKRIRAQLKSQADRAQVFDTVKELGTYFANEMYSDGWISDTDWYLDLHSEELIYKASLATKADEELVEEVVLLEFETFDKVQNEGGRASCQDDWGTFSIMRKSQYQTWSREMLMQYLYDFRREINLGHNLIEEKYGRMMKSTAPQRYAEIVAHFPAVSEEKERVVEQICGIQVAWMEEFADKYPKLAGNARSIHTYEDTVFQTSYETYLRGEITTYSDKMLELYGRYIVSHATNGINLAFEIMENNVKMYGYQSLDIAEETALINANTSCRI